jgi:hypothetical protein
VVPSIRYDDGVGAVMSNLHMVAVLSASMSAAWRSESSEPSEGGAGGGSSCMHDKRSEPRTSFPPTRETPVYFLRTLNSSSVLFAILCISFFSIETEEQDPDLLVKLISEVTRSMNEQLMKSLSAKDVKKTR